MERGQEQSQKTQVLAPVPSLTSLATLYKLLNNIVKFPSLRSYADKMAITMPVLRSPGPYIKGLLQTEPHSPRIQRLKL